MADQVFSLQSELGNAPSDVNITTTAPSNRYFQLLDPRSLNSLNMSDRQALFLERIRLEQEEQARVDSTITILLRRQQEEQQLIREASVRRIRAQAFHTAPFSSVYSNVYFPGMLPYQPEFDLLTQFPRPSQPRVLENSLYLSDVFRTTNRRASDWPISSSETQQDGVSPLAGLASSPLNTTGAGDGEALGEAASSEATKNTVGSTGDEERTPIRFEHAESRSIESNASHFTQGEQDGKGKSSTGSNTITRKAVKRSRASPKRDETSLCSSQMKHSKQRKKGSSNQTLTMPKRDRRKYDSESFAVKLFRMCSDQDKMGKRDIVEFLDEGGGIWLHDPQRMVSELIPKYFRGRTFTSFRRQLVSYGFRKSKHSKEAASCGAYVNHLFCRGKPELCKQIMRDTRYDRGRKVCDINQDSDA